MKLSQYHGDQQQHQYLQQQVTTQQVVGDSISGGWKNISQGLKKPFT